MNHTTVQQQQQEEQQQSPDIPAVEGHSSHISDETEHSTPENPTARPACDGSTVEVAKRRRGRPRGSRNKPKTPVVFPRDADPSLAAWLPQMLEIPSGYDVAELLAQLARGGNHAVNVTAAKGAVSNVVLRNLQLREIPSQTPADAPLTIGLRGQYDILSMSGIFLPPSASQNAASFNGVISIMLAGPQGQVVGGTVAGRLVAAGTVIVVASVINPTTQLLRFEGCVSLPVSVSGGGGGGGAEMMEHDNHVYNQQQDHRLHGQQGPAPTAAMSAGMSNYSSHVMPGGLWAPTVPVPMPQPPRPNVSLFPF